MKKHYCNVIPIFLYDRIRTFFIVCKLALGTMNAPANGGGETLPGGYAGNHTRRLHKKTHGRTRTGTAGTDARATDYKHCR